MAAKTLSELIGKKTVIGYEGNYFEAKIVAIDPQLGWVKIENIENAEEFGIRWYSLQKVDYIQDA